MNVKEKILNRSKSFFENNLPEERFKILMTIKEGIQFDLDSLKLVDIYVDSKADAHNITKIQTFVHVFKLNDSITVEIDVLEDSFFIKEVAVHGDYFYSIVPATNEGELFRNGDVEDYGLCDVLDAINYSAFFNEEYDMLAQLVSSVNQEEAKQLFLKVKDSYPELINISSGDSPKEFVMHFSTDAELIATKDNILSGHYTAQSKAKII